MDTITSDSQDCSQWSDTLPKMLQRRLIIVHDGSRKKKNLVFCGVRWPRGLEHWLGLATGRSRPGCGKLRFGTLVIPFTPLCQCLSEETLKAVGPFYLVSMPGDVKDPTSPHWNV